MPLDPVYCKDCDNVETHSRKQRTYLWLCLKFRSKPRGAIAPEVLDVDPPFERCIDVNKFNNCQEFTPLKEKEDVHAEAE